MSDFVTNSAAGTTECNSTASNNQVENAFENMVGDVALLACSPEGSVGSAAAEASSAEIEKAGAATSFGENLGAYTCAICLGSIWTKKSGLCDPCGHIFHQSCFCEWAMTRTSCSFLVHEYRLQQTKCPMCNTGVQKLLNMFWTSSREEHDVSSHSSSDDSEEEKQENCSYFAYLEKRIQEETAAINFRISHLEGQVEVVKTRNAKLSEQVEQVQLDMKKIKADVDQEKQLRIELAEQRFREQQFLEEESRTNRSSSSRRKGATKRKRDKMDASGNDNNNNSSRLEIAQTTVGPTSLNRIAIQVENATAVTAESLQSASSFSNNENIS